MVLRPARGSRLPWSRGFPGWDRARVRLDRARRGPAVTLLHGAGGDRDIKAALRERECRAPADTTACPRDHGLGSRAVFMLAHARIVPRTLEPCTLGVDLYTKPSCRIRVVTSFFTSRFGIGLSIAKCSEPLVCL